MSSDVPFQARSRDAATAGARHMLWTTGIILEATSGDKKPCIVNLVMCYADKELLLAVPTPSRLTRAVTRTN